MTALVSLLTAPFAAWWGLWAVLAAAARRRPRPVADGGVRRIDVVVPAHDEEARVGDHEHPPEQRGLVLGAQAAHEVTPRVP